MNSGVLNLNTRRNVSCAPDGGEAGRAAQVKRQATARIKDNRGRKIFMVLCDRKAVNASIRGVADCHALRPQHEQRWNGSKNPLRHSPPETSRSHSHREDRAAAWPAPPANGTKPRRARRLHPGAPASPTSPRAPAPSTASGACPRVHGRRRRLSLAGERSCALPRRTVPPPAKLRGGLPPSATPCADSARRTHSPRPSHVAQILRSTGRAAHEHRAGLRQRSLSAPPGELRSGASGSAAHHSRRYRSPSARPRPGPHQALESSHPSLTVYPQKSPGSWHQVYGEHATPATPLCEVVCKRFGLSTGYAQETGEHVRD